MMLLHSTGRLAAAAAGAARQQRGAAITTTNSSRPALLSAAPASALLYTSQQPQRQQQQQQRRRRLVAAEAALKDTAAVPVQDKGELSTFPQQPAVYAVYDPEGNVQYIGLTRKLDVTVSNHMRDLPALTAAIKYEVVTDATRDTLTAAWKAWMEETLSEGGAIPPGNAPGVTTWQARAARPKADIKLTAGKAINVPIETLIDQVVKGNKVVAFIKGTRSQPQCGFSHKMLTILNDMRSDYEVVNVLDEFHNPGLRDAIKTYSAWPTIPQLYIGGEFVGGSDIVEEMQGNGELAQLLRAGEPAAAATPASAKQ